MRNYLRVFIIFFIAALAAAGMIAIAGTAYADIYKFMDEDGVLHLTNKPLDHKAKYVLVLREKRVLFQSNIDIQKYDDLIKKAAAKHRLDPALIKAIIKAESNFNHQAVSKKGAQGLMQLMPSTASSLDVDDCFEPEKNIEGGAKYLRYLLSTYKGDIKLALAAYNAGEKAVAKYNYRVPPYRETQDYVARVESFYDSFRNR
jgi:soluble lytic murein transglycosylase-like protein